MKIALIVLDSVGVGALPDAADFGDAGAHTIGNIAKSVADFKLPNLTRLGFGNIHPSLNLEMSDAPLGCFGCADEQSQGKDTTIGHWEIAGIVTEKSFPTFPGGFPAELMAEFEKRIGTKSIGNVVGSGTDIIDQFGVEHMETGYPIIYTSADSVFQIAMHEEVISIERQYEICQIARDLLINEFAVARVIARPFLGAEGSFKRTTNRKDFSVEPQDENLLTALKNAGIEVASIGKIEDIFCGSGITSSQKTKNNNDGIDVTIETLKKDFEGLIFTNLIDFDMHFGHRRNVEGYAKCLQEFDARIPDLMNALGDDDVMIITADHGNDPTFPGSDHTREYIPVLVYGKKLKSGINVGVRPSFSDIGATIAEAFHVDYNLNGTSFWQSINE